jgi:uncharacterized membrane protein
MAAGHEARQRRRMEAVLVHAAAVVAESCELFAVLVTAGGAVGAAVRITIGWRTFGDLVRKKQIFLRFAANISLALEFALAADIAQTVIAPTWRDIGQLAAIAGIRTFLNIFLERDLKTAARRDAPLEG